MAQWLHAGRVGRPHGLDGAFHVTYGRWLLLAVGERLMVDDDEREVQRRAGTPERPIVRVSGVADRDAAEALRGAELRRARLGAPEPEDGAYWAEDLEGLAVTDGATAVGVVSGLIELPSCEALRVTRPDGGELLVPMVSDAVREIDVASARVDVDLSFLGEGV